MSFTESMRRRGKATSSRILQTRRVKPTEVERLALGLESGEQARVLERLRLADGVPMAIGRAVMPVELAERLDGDLENGSLHAAFKRLGRFPTKALSEVSEQHSPKQQRDLLDLPSTGIILCESRTITDQDGRPLERTETSTRRAGTRSGQCWSTMGARVSRHLGLDLGGTFIKTAVIEGADAGFVTTSQTKRETEAGAGPKRLPPMSRQPLSKRSPRTRRSPRSALEFPGSSTKALG